MSYFFTCFLSYLPTYMWNIMPCIPFPIFIETIMRIIYTYLSIIFTFPFPPLAQACSLCPIQNSQFPSHYLERIIGLKNAYLYGK